jgi:hypothetical protein
MCSAVDWLLLISKWDAVEGYYVRCQNPWTSCIQHEDNSHCWGTTDCLHNGVRGSFTVCSVTLEWTEYCYIHIGQVFLSFESSFSIQVKHLPLQLCRLQTVCSCLWIARYSHFLTTGITESIAPTECLKSYSVSKEIMKALCSVIIRPIEYLCCCISLITTEDSSLINTAAWLYWRLDH